MNPYDIELRAYGPDDIAEALEAAEDRGRPDDRATPAWRTALARAVQRHRRQTMRAVRSSRAPAVVKIRHGRPGTDRARSAFLR